jgi:hypothetical protein
MIMEGKHRLQISLAKIPQVRLKKLSGQNNQSPPDSGRSSGKITPCGNQSSVYMVRTRWMSMNP